MFGQDDHGTPSGTRRSPSSSGGIDEALLRLIPGTSILAFDRAFRVVAEGGTERATSDLFRSAHEGVHLRDRLLPEVYTLLEARCVDLLDGRGASFELPWGARSYSVQAVCVRTGTAAGMLCFTDITPLRRAEAEREALRGQLERSNRELQEFISLASHDLQEPLRKVQAFGDRLKSRYARVLGIEGNEQLRRMNGAIGRMQILIHDLLTYSRIATKAQPFERVDLALCASEALSDLRSIIERSGGRVEVGELDSIEADPSQIRLVFRHLLDNALKFHREAEPPMVYLRGAALGEVYTIEVEDNGIGFDERHLERILGLFKRLHSRNTFDGTGIGLAICRKIIERHGGTISARSTLDQGSSFIVSLPRQQPIWLENA